MLQSRPASSSIKNLPVNSNIQTLSQSPRTRTVDTNVSQVGETEAVLAHTPPKFWALHSCSDHREIQNLNHFEYFFYNLTFDCYGDYKDDPIWLERTYLLVIDPKIAD